MKKLLALVLSLVMLCSVFAVASAENGEKITIRVTWWGEVSENDAEMMMIEKFNAEHDDIAKAPISSLPARVTSTSGWARACPCP